MKVARKSLDYEPEDKEREPESSKKIEEHWIDRFYELAKGRNEDWRTELLARALAKETANPSSVTTRALWLIGNLEEETFRCFSQILDHCVSHWPDRRLFFPGRSGQNWSDLKLHNNETITIGKACFVLGGSGLIADTLTTYRQLEKGATAGFRYNDEMVALNFKSHFSMRGVILTPLGDELSGFYDQDYNATGMEYFKSWIDSLPPDIADKQYFKLSEGFMKAVSPT